MKKTNKKPVKRKTKRNTRKKVARKKPVRKTTRKTKRKTVRKKTKSKSKNPKKSVKKTSKGLFGKTVNKIQTKGSMGTFYLSTTKQDYNVPKEIIIDNKKFLLKNELGSGTFGYIYSYESNNQEIAVKIGVVDMDIKAGKKINAGEKKRICYPKVVPYQNTNNLFIMEKMDGDLIQYRTKNKGKIPYNEIYEIINIMAKTIKCLIKMGIYYTDIKAQNTLYNKKNGKLSIYLGDLGGAEPRYGRNYITTFEPFDKRKTGIGIPTEKDLSWMFGILLLQLLNGNSYQFHWSKIKNMTHIGFLVRKNKILKKYENIETVYTLLKGTLTSLPKDRFTLDQIIKLTN